MSFHLLSHYLSIAYRDLIYSFGREESLKDAYNRQVLNKAKMFWEAPGHGCKQENDGALPSGLYLACYYSRHSEGEVL